MASGEGQVIAVHSLDEWSQHFEKGVQTKKLVVVDFTATWCGPCRLIAPVFAELAAKMRDVIFLKVDVDELKDVVEEFQIEAMPTFLFFKDGKIVDKVVGARKEDLALKVDTHFNALATA